LIGTIGFSRNDKIFQKILKNLFRNLKKRVGLHWGPHMTCSKMRVKTLMNTNRYPNTNVNTNNNTKPNPITQNKNKTYLEINWYFAIASWNASQIVIVWVSFFHSKINVIFKNYFCQKIYFTTFWS